MKAYLHIKSVVNELLPLLIGVCYYFGTPPIVVLRHLGVDKERKKEIYETLKKHGFISGEIDTWTFTDKVVKRLRANLAEKTFSAKVSAPTEVHQVSVIDLLRKIQKAAESCRRVRMQKLVGDFAMLRLVCRRFDPRYIETQIEPFFRQADRTQDLVSISAFGEWLKTNAGVKHKKVNKAKLYAK